MARSSKAIWTRPCYNSSSERIFQLLNSETLMLWAHHVPQGRKLSHPPLGLDPVSGKEASSLRAAFLNQALLRTGKISMLHSVGQAKGFGRPAPVHRLGIEKHWQQRKCMPFPFTCLLHQKRLWCTSFCPGLL